MGRMEENSKVLQREASLEKWRESFEYESSRRILLEKFYYRAEY